MMEDPIDSYMRDLTLPDPIKQKTALRARMLRDLWWRKDLDPYFVPPVIELLRSDDPALRQRAANTLMSFKDERVVLPLIAALQDEEPMARDIYLNPMVSALGDLGDSRAIAPLTSVLAKQNDLDFVCMKALGQVGAVSALIEYSKHLNADVRLDAVHALNWILDFGEEREAVVQSLTEALQDSKSMVRSAAKRVLRKLKI